MKKKNPIYYEDLYGFVFLIFLIVVVCYATAGAVFIHHFGMECINPNSFDELMQIKSLSI